MSTQSHKKASDIIHRWEGNPIISISDLPFQASDIRNAGAVKIGKTYLLLVSIADLKGHTKLYVATSKDGYYFYINPKPLLQTSKEPHFAKFEELGIMDARITPLDNTYYITFIANSHYGYRACLAKTKDFKSVTRLGFISQVDVKSAALFPEKINNRYVKIERPAEGGRTWISFSDDLQYWGNDEALISPRGGYWDSSRVGHAGPPIRLENGHWLLLYYGIRDTASGPLCRIGAVCLDSKDPRILIGRTNVPILSPREDYERIGDVQNLVFSCGAILEKNKLTMYYGASGSCICMGTTTVEEIENACLKSEEEF